MRSVALFLALALWSAAEARPKRTGLIRIQTTVEGAAVAIDGKPIGETPIDRPIQLSIGQHTLKVTRQGYTPYIDVVRVKAGKSARISVELLPVAGFFLVRANVADARVFLDGKYVGTAPVDVEAVIGAHSLKVTKPGYYDAIVERRTAAGQSVMVAVALDPLPIGTTPYRPLPPPRAKWYERWYVWVGAAAAAAAVATAIAVPVALSNREVCPECDFKFSTTDGR